MNSLPQSLTCDERLTPKLETQRGELSVVDLRKSFVSPAGMRIEVLRGVSLEVKPGEVVAIVGASGSGKSTLLHLLGGLDDPDHGVISVGDVELSSFARDAKAIYRQSHIGFVFQFHYLMNDLSALENVALPLLISRLDWKESLRKASILLNAFGLTERIDHAASHLSGGEQQRVALARALINSPRLVLADEPTGNLDTIIGDEIGRTLVEYVRSHGVVGIIATHNETLAGLCDRTMLLENGRLSEI